ncbi:MAG: Rne/Rng family ribonuclease [Eubacteriaceae bacterium]
MNRIIIDSIFGQIRVCIVKDDILIHFFIERETNWNNYGDIFMGRVEQIKPGIQGAFININNEKNALLHVSDIMPNPDNLPIDKLLKQGQEILVQVKKEAVGTKGARLTTKFSISGHYLVLLPTENKVFVSKKIISKEEKQRLKNAVNNIKPDDCGVIIRTEAIGIEIDILKSELTYLISKWSKINDVERAPKLILKDESIALKTIRDYYSCNMDEIVVNDINIEEELKEYFNIYFHKDKNKIRLINQQNLLQFYGIEGKISELFNRKIWLKSGAYIVIDYTEAFTVIDVNSGKFTGKKNIDETMLKINLEASEVIADQIRLRNISGIILIDYINIRKEKAQQKIINTLNEYLLKDKVKTKVYGFTELCILQMTRKQQGKSIYNLNSQQCKICNGTGLMPNQEYLFYKCLTLLEKSKEVIRNEKVSIKLNPYIKNMLKEIELYKSQFTFVQMIEDFYKIEINIQEDITLDIEEMKIIPY